MPKLKQAKQSRLRNIRKAQVKRAQDTEKSREHPEEGAEMII